MEMERNEIIAEVANMSEQEQLSGKSNLMCHGVLSGMSHEIRTQMNAIVAFSYLMSDDELIPDERREYSKQVHTACEQLIGLFDSFLDSAIIDTGIPGTELKKYKISNLIDEPLSEFREILGREAYRDITLVTESSYDGNSEVYVDTNKIFRVLRIIFMNALRNTRNGYIKVGYYLRDEKLTLYVLDSGQGYFKCKEFLHTEDLNQSLSKFNDTSSAINLTLAKKIINILGGKVWVECNGLTGTGIFFSVPGRAATNSEININKYKETMIAI
jgi:K+-sensing histidine kinase KdpD